MRASVSRVAEPSKTRSARTHFLNTVIGHVLLQLLINIMGSNPWSTDCLPGPCHQRSPYRPGYRGNRPYRPAPVTVPAGYQLGVSKNFEFEFQKLKIVEKSLKILRLLSLMVSNLLQT
jgi:hypothetical protein